MDDLEPLDKQFSFLSLSAKVTALSSQHTAMVDELDRMRKRRYFNAYEDGKSALERGIIDADEMIIPSRLIDTNIRREAPDLIKFITGPNRTLALSHNTPTSSVDDPSLAMLETDFTRKARYPNWQVDWLKAIDCTQAYGYSIMRVDFDEDMDGNFKLCYVNRRNLMFNEDAINLESQGYLVEIVKVTGHELYDYVEDGDFNEEVVAGIIGGRNNNGSTSIDNQAEASLNKTYDVYKVYFKKSDEVVHVAWLAQGGSTKWLKAPKPLWLGKYVPLDSKEEDRLVYETSYPFVMVRYTEDEADAIKEIRGRIELDQADEEVATVLYTAICRSAHRATWLQAAPAAATGADNLYPDGEPKQSDTMVKDGKVWTRAMNFSHLPFVGDGPLAALNSVLVKNQSEQSRPDFAVRNRKDSRKTATELDMAEKASNQLASVQVLLLSLGYLEAYAKCWMIYRNRVLTGQLVLSPELTLTLNRPLILRAAGDIDIVEREAKLQKRLSLYTIVSPTAAGLEMLKDILRDALPEDAERYIALLTQDQSKNAFIQQMLQQLQGLLSPADFAQIEQQAQQAVATQGSPQPT